MFQWYREYTSVLTREHGSLLGAIFGITFGVAWFFFHRAFQDPMISLTWYGLGAWIGGIYVMGRVITLAVAFWVRRQHPTGKAVRKPLKMTASERHLRRWNLWFLVGTILELFLVNGLRRAGLLTLGQSTVALPLLVLLTLLLRNKMAPAPPLKKGSFAVKVWVASWWALGISLGAVIVMELWIRLVLLRQ
jgi:hypothetical protein